MIQQSVGDLSVIGSRLGGIKMNPGAKQPSSSFCTGKGYLGRVVLGREGMLCCPEEEL